MYRKLINVLPSIRNTLLHTKPTIIIFPAHLRVFMNFLDNASIVTLMTNTWIHSIEKGMAPKLGQVIHFKTRDQVSFKTNNRAL